LSSWTRGSRILITGGTGHTGRRLVEALTDRGEVLRVLTRYPAGLQLPLRRKVEIFRGSLDDPQRAHAAGTDCAAVIALTHIKFAPNVIDLMRANGIRRGVFMSSTRRFTKYPEETARQVIAGEQAVRESGLDYTILRASMIYGGKQDNNMEHLLRNLRKWPVHPLVGGGRMKWQPVFTWDVVHAILACLDKSETIGKEYTIAGPEPITYAEMVRTIMHEAKLRRAVIPIPIGLARAAVKFYASLSETPRIRPDQIERLQEDKIFDISDAQRDLDFHPVPFSEGIRRKLALDV
jgi:uncharacterized protein YbjT (DUF2867 family)